MPTFIVCGTRVQTLHQIVLAESFADAAAKVSCGDAASSLAVKESPNCPRYSIGTWDTDEQAYTPQVGLTVPSLNICHRQLLTAFRELKAMGYSCHRRRSPEGDHDGNDWSVLVERTDGMSEAEILESWKR